MVVRRRWVLDGASSLYFSNASICICYAYIVFLRPAGLRNGGTQTLGAGWSLVAVLLQREAPTTNLTFESTLRLPTKQVY